MKSMLLFLFSLLCLQVSAQKITVSGTVTDLDGEPLLGVNVRIAGTDIGTMTNMDGDYEMFARIGQALVFSYVGMRTEKVLIKDRSPINVSLSPDAELDPVYITITNIPKSRKRSPYPVTTLSSKDIEKNSDPDLVRKMVGKVPGAQITGTSGAVGSGTNFFIRSKSSITGNNQPLFVVDGVPFNTGTNNVTDFQGGNTITTSRFLDLDPNNIAKVQVLKGLSATVLYGQEGRNGVVLITTKTGSFSDEAIGPDLPYSERILKQQEEARTALANMRTFEEEGYISDYQDAVKSILNSKDRLNAFKSMEASYSDDPAYYLDIYDRFKRIDPEFADGLLSYFPEVKNDNPEFLKVLAFKLEEQKKFDEAVAMYEKLMKLLPGSMQVKRNLALALQNAKRPEDALDVFQSLVNPEAEKVNGFEQIINTELRNLFVNSPKLLDQFQVDRKDLKFDTYDLRAVIDWNKSDVNLDLTVVDPNLEYCSPANAETRSAGVLTSNSNYGHGPETYEQGDLLSGSYYLKVKYSEGEADLEPIYVKLTLYKNYGTADQSAEVRVLRVSGEADLELIDRIAAN